MLENDVQPSRRPTHLVFTFTDDQSVKAIFQDTRRPDSKIMELINVLKEHYRAGKSPSSLKYSDDFGLTLPRHIVPYLKSKSDDKNVDPYSLEFYVYQEIYHHFDRGRMFCNDSVSFGDLENDLVANKFVDDVEKIA